MPLRTASAAVEGRPRSLESQAATPLQENPSGFRIQDSSTSGLPSHLGVAESDLNALSSELSPIRMSHMNFLRRNAATSFASSSNHSPFLRFASNRLCQYASMPDGSSVRMI